jgi:hypothetical protein
MCIELYHITAIFLSHKFIIDFSKFFNKSVDGNTLTQKIIQWRNIQM